MTIMHQIAITVITLVFFSATQKLWWTCN